MRILAVPGLEKTSGGFKQKLAQLALEENWDADALAAVMSFESAGTFAANAGWQQWSPQRTATGLIQFLEATAKSLGVEPVMSAPHPELVSRGAGKSWATWRLMSMTPEDQLDLVRLYYRRVFQGGHPSRPVDYYTAIFNGSWGKPDAHIIATEGSPEYDRNKGLDRDDSKTITVGDLARVVEGRMGQAKGMFFDVVPEAPVKWKAPAVLVGTLLVIGGYALLALARDESLSPGRLRGVLRSV